MMTSSTARIENVRFISKTSSQLRLLGIDLLRQDTGKAHPSTDALDVGGKRPVMGTGVPSTLSPTVATQPYRVYMWPVGHDTADALTINITELQLNHRLRAPPPLTQESGACRRTRNAASEVVSRGVGAGWAASELSLPAECRQA